MNVQELIIKCLNYQEGLVEKNVSGPVRFTMRSSCAPFKFCKKSKKKTIFINPNNLKEF